MPPIILILLATPSLCYAHPDFFEIAVESSGILVLLALLLVFLYKKNEKSKGSHNTKLAIGCVLNLLSIAVGLPLLIIAICLSFSGIGPLPLIAIICLVFFLVKLFRKENNDKWL
jgi:hypothetical protein